MLQKGISWMHSAGFAMRLCSLYSRASYVYDGGYSKIVWLYVKGFRAQNW